MDRRQVLAEYDEQVRRSTAPDGTGATFESDGVVLRRIARPGHGGSGVYWSALRGANADAVIAGQVAFFAARGEEFEWKLYDYDEPADLAGRLLAAGLVPEAAESLMIGRVADVRSALRAADPPPGITIEQVTGEAGIDRLVAVHEEVFGRDESELRESLRARLIWAGEPTGLVLAVAGGQAVSAARVDILPGCRFAGLWGGGTLPRWRGRGIYRALVRYRAELAARQGCEYLTVDALDTSKPILERSGFTALATTTPYTWSPGH
jgi:GNAT superfamily N-acetyltransferase